MELHDYVYFIFGLWYYFSFHHYRISDVSLRACNTYVLRVMTINQSISKQPLSKKQLLQKLRQLRRLLLFTSAYFCNMRSTFYRMFNIYIIKYKLQNTCTNSVKILNISVHLTFFLIVVLSL